MRNTIGSALAVGAALTLGVALTVAVVIPRIVEAELYFWPPLYGWHVTHWRVDGEDLVLSGTVVKPRRCRYVPPPRARDGAGKNYLVVSESPTSHMTWAPSKLPQHFGPWRIPGGAGQALHYYQEYDCHPGWTLIVEHGIFDPRAPQ